MRFDVSALPLGLTVHTIALDVVHDAGGGGPSGNPQVNVYRVDDDSWARGAVDPHPGVSELLTWAPMSNFPTQNLFPVTFSFDPNAANWDIDFDRAQYDG